jgi:hypothetical protein
LYHFPGGRRSRWLESDLPHKLQGTLLLCFPKSPSRLRSFLQIWMTFSLVCADRRDLSLLLVV